MVARKGKSVMKLVRLPILRPLMIHKCDILWWFERLKDVDDLYGKKVA